MKSRGFPGGERSPPGDSRGEHSGKGYSRGPQGSLRISPRPQMEGGRLGEDPGRVFSGFHIRKHSQNIAKIDPNQGEKSVEIGRNPWKSGLADRM